MVMPIVFLKDSLEAASCVSITFLALAASVRASTSYNPMFLPLLITPIA